MKRKFLSRFMAASLATVMTIGLAGCGGGDDSGSSGSQESSKGSESTEQSPAGGSSEGQDSEVSSEPEGDIDPYPVLTDKDGNVPDLGGMEIIIRDWFSGDGSRGEANNSYTEALYEYQDWAQEKYNFTLKQMTISGWGDVPGDYQNYVTGGGDENNYIFILRTGGELIQMMKNDMMYDLKTLDCLDFSQPKWQESNVHLQYTDVVTGKINAMRPVYAEPRGGMYFNKRVLQEAGINPDDIYQWQESGEWTWDKFVECCEKITRDTDSDGVLDIHALTGQDTVFYGEAVASNNADYVALENGKYVNKLESNETMQAMNWAVDVWKKHNTPYPEDAQWNYFSTIWQEGKAGFFAGQAYSAGQDFGPNYVKNEETGQNEWDGTYKVPDELGFVCFPKGPAASDYTNIYDDNVYVIPACYDADKAWKLAFALNVWTEPIPGYEDYSAFREDQRINFRDSESVDLTLARLMENGRLTYHGMVNGIEVGGDLYWKLNENNSLAQQVEAIRDKWNYYIAIANGEDAEKPQSMIDEEKAAEEAAAAAAEGE